MENTKSSGTPDNTSFTKLNDALLAEVPDDKEPKRNSKDDIIHKILMCAEDNDVSLEYSDTRLRRMTKKRLIEVLADTMEKSVRNQCAKQVGAKPGAADSVIALGALKMIHTIAATTAEKGLNVFLPRYGYEVEGFAKSLKEPSVEEAIDCCLAEIAAETDVLSYVQSPYARLAIAWSGALVTSMKKTMNYRNRRYAPRMESRAVDRKDTLQPRAGGWPEARQEHLGKPPLPTHAIPI